MIPDEIKAEIMQRLYKAEKDHNVRIVMAIESGSRAWGFESVNSDYDVRFIYCHPKDWYLSVDLEDKRDVIEYDIVDEIDLNGWDIRKALKLFYKSNPAFVEWIQSPITYIENGKFRVEAQSILPKIYSQEKGIYHYKSMAKSNFRQNLQKELVKQKKYFYVLRPLLAVKWLEKYKKPAPIEFDTLLSLVDDQALLKMILELLERKKSGVELEKIPAIPVIHQFIENELKRLEQINIEKHIPNIDISVLNKLFHAVLNEAN